MNKPKRSKSGRRSLFLANPTGKQRFPKLDNKKVPGFSWTNNPLFPVGTLMSKDDKNEPFYIKPRKDDGSRWNATELEQYFDERDFKFEGKFQDIQNALESFDNSTIPDVAMSGGNNGNKGNSTNSTRPDKPSDFLIDEKGDSSMFNSTNSSDYYSYESKDVHNSNSMNSKGSSNYSNFTGSGTLGDYGSSAGGFGNGSNKRGNGSASSTALFAGKGSGSRWYGIQEFVTSDINYKSGIPSGITFDPDPDYEHGHSQLYISQGSFFNMYQYDWSKLEVENGKARDLTKKLDNSYTKVMGEDIYYSYLHQIEKVRNRELGMNFSQSDFFEYTDSVIQGLQMYYCLDSIFAYDKEANKFNSGMSYLRERISTDVVSEFANLRRCLEKQVIKPEIVSFIRFMYQNFQQHEGENTSIVKLSYFDLLADDLDRDYLSDARMIRHMINQINEDFSKAFSYLSGGYPTYKLYGKLPPSTTKVLINTDFNTWWHNHLVSFPEVDPNVMTEFNGIRYSKDAINESSEIYFGIYGNTLDGVMHAASSAYVDIKSGALPGLWQPILWNNDVNHFRDKNKTNACGLKAYNGSTGTKRFIGAATDKKIGINAGLCTSFHHIYDVPGKTLDVVRTYYHPASIHKALSHSVKLMRQSVFEGVRYLLHP